MGNISTKFDEKWQLHFSCSIKIPFLKAKKEGQQDEAAYAAIGNEGNHKKGSELGGKSTKHGAKDIEAASKHNDA
jgi:hypothetical protein